MSEEVRNSAPTIPKIAMLTIVINSIMAFGMLITLLFTMGSVEDALSTPTGFPIIEIFLQVRI